MTAVVAIHGQDPQADWQASVPTGLAAAYTVLGVLGRVLGYRVGCKAPAARLEGLISMTFAIRCHPTYRLPP